MICTHAVIVLIDVWFFLQELVQVFFFAIAITEASHLSASLTAAARLPDSPSEPCLASAPQQHLLGIRAPDVQAALDSCLFLE